MNDRVLISPAELVTMTKSEKVVLIDTRDAASFAEAHIPGAVNIHEVFTYLATSTPEGLAALRDTFAAAFGRAGLSGEETAIIYEQSMATGFGQSCRGYVLLRHMGYPKIRVLHGGYTAWRAAGFPSATEISASTIGTSYEMSIATERKAPSSAYLLFDDQPASMIASVPMAPIEIK